MTKEKNIPKMDGSRGGKRDNENRGGCNNPKKVGQGRNKNKKEVKNEMSCM